ncbi:anhydro-N-acetylmuramic acid kinase [Gallaecimonas mangrovi]|uniref:anhydro-N-acetylmuramic acid kinase n=1 Tax=Gallaecimonas mangrovi TaxID=2291597 RepID=UPI000E1FE2FB|nr:anhydro-N-acetylmuramic acid kinase [Gallaecimonas mangrovi]
MSLYIGLMSGTSMDGIDAVLVDFKAPTPTLLATHLEPLPSKLCEGLHQLCQPGSDDLDAVMSLSLAFAQTSAQAVKNLLAKTEITAEQIRAIGSHGQTIRHRPQWGFSAQIGDAATLAVATGIDVISNFRMKDLALGGQGAPLVPAFHKAMLKSDAVLNIGGIANITYLGEKVCGFDTGPGNTLMDAWMRRHHGQPFDHNGQFAASGQVLPALLAKLLAEPYFAEPWPKSTGRELFHLDWLDSFLTGNEAPADVQATLLELTVQSVALHLDKLGVTGEVAVCGGGAQNPQLMQALKSRLPALHWSTTDQQGLPGDWLEAMAFAWLARQFTLGLAGNLPEATGAKRPTILGQLTKAC